MNYTKEKLLDNVKNSWLHILDNENLNIIIKELNKLENELIFPKINNIFETFKYFEISELKLVILGQDPYHNLKNDKYPQANGLAFSVTDEFPIPPSLKNIYKELKNEYSNFTIPNNGNLIRWVKEEKILLLNTSLTVIAHKPSSHIKLWNNYINYVINRISLQSKNVTFLLLGNYAQKKIKYIDNKLNRNINIIKAVHPSPLSANRGFFNSKIFIECNNYILLIFNLKKLYFCFPFFDKSLELDIIIKIFQNIQINLINWEIKNN